MAGGGLLGLCTAWYLRRRGLSVTVFDAGRAGGAASWAGGGILWPIYPWRYPLQVQNLALAGAARYPALCKALYAAPGIDCELRRCGALVLDEGEREAALAWAATRGWDAVVQDAAVLTAIAPGLRARQAVALPQVTQLRNPRLCRALVQALRRDGVAVREHCAVHGLRLSAGRIQELDTEQGPALARRVVIAAGAWSDQLAPAGVVPRVRPVRGQMLLLRGRPGLLPGIVIRAGRYLIPRADGRIL
ncbi:MAG: FAD-binding oxidoreductase, partial [Salinisphaera sp.]|nr:FAD-binding oxidoreductase [Salinisphaera sp.]